MSGLSDKLAQYHNLTVGWERDFGRQQVHLLCRAAQVLLHTIPELLSSLGEMGIMARCE